MEDIPSGLYQATSYVNLTLVGLGLVGSLCMIRLATASSVQKYSCSIFLITLALSDIVVLVFEGLEDVALLLPNVTTGDILYGYSEWRCRFSIFSQETARLLSSWMVVALAAEMYLTTCSENKRAFVATHKRANQLNLSVILITFASCFPFLVITTSTEDNSCSSKYSLFYDIYARIIMKCLTDMFTPVIYIFWCTAFVLIHKVRFEHEKTYVLDYDTAGNPKHKKKEAMRLTPGFVLGLALVYAVLVLPYGITDLLQTLLRLKERYWPAMNLAFSNSYQLIFAYNISRVFLVLAYSSKFYLAFWLDKSIRKALKQECFSFGQIKQPVRYDAEPARYNGEGSQQVKEEHVYDNHAFHVPTSDISRDFNVIDIADFHLYNNITITQF